MVNEPQQQIVGFGDGGRKGIGTGIGHEQSCTKKTCLAARRKTRESPGHSVTVQRETGPKHTGLRGVLGTTKADVVIAGRRREPVPARRIHDDRMIGPRPTTEHFVFPA